MRPGAGRAEADFDHHDAAWLARRHDHNAELRALAPVVWNSRYGYWYVTGYEEAVAVARDSDTFTLRYESEPVDGIELIGITGVPRVKGLPAIGIAEADRERHAALRRLLNPLLGPRAVAARQAFVEQSASWLVDQRISQGEMDLVSDYTSAVPALMTMTLLGLPCEQWRRYADIVHATSSYPRGAPGSRRAAAEIPVALGEIVALAAERRRRPGDDVLSLLVTSEVAGRYLGDDEVAGVAWNLVAGGLDTTTSLTSLALHHLDEHHELRERLRGDPDLLFAACEEYLRYTTVNETLTSTCTRDTVLGGQRIRRGDVVMTSWLAADFDPAVFEHPEQVDIDRSPNPHLAFGTGAHRCIGMHLARLMFRVMVREVLERIPDYRLVPGGTRFSEGNPLLSGVLSMPATFTPGPARGVERPF